MGNRVNAHLLQPNPNHSSDTINPKPVDHNNPLAVAIKSTEEAIALGVSDNIYSNVAGEFTAAFSDGTGLTLSNLSFVPSVQSLILVDRRDTAGDSQVVDITSVIFTDNEDGTYKYALANRPTTFVTTDVYSVFLIGPSKAMDSDLDARKGINLNPPWEHYTAPEAYTTLTATSATWLEGAVIDMRGYNTLNYYFEYDAAAGDAAYLRVISLLTVDGARDHRHVVEALSGSASTPASKYYVYAAGADTNQHLVIPSNGAPFLRIDAKRDVASGVNAEFTGSINKVNI